MRALLLEEVTVGSDAHAVPAMAKSCRVEEREKERRRTQCRMQGWDLEQEA